MGDAMGGANVHVVSPEDWIKGIALSVAASVIGGASKLAIRKSWVMLEAHGICTGVGGGGGGGASGHSSNNNTSSSLTGASPPGGASRIASKNCCVGGGGGGRTKLKRNSSSESTEELLPSGGGGGAGAGAGGRRGGQEEEDAGGGAVTRSRTPPRNRHSRSPSRSSSAGTHGNGGGAGGGGSSSGGWSREDNTYEEDGGAGEDGSHGVAGAGGAETEMMEVGRASTYDPVSTLLATSGSTASAGSAPARMHSGHHHQRPDTTIIPQMLVPACGVTATCGVLSAYDGDGEDEGDDGGEGRRAKRSVLRDAFGSGSFASVSTEADDNEMVELRKKDRNSYRPPPVAVDVAGDEAVAGDGIGSGLPPSSIDTRTFSPRDAPPPPAAAAEIAAIETRSKILRYMGMFGMTVLNPICCVWAMQYASPSILAPFSGLTLVWIVLFSETMVGERPQPVQVFAAGLIILGEVIVAIFGDHTNDEGVTVDDVREGYRAPWFIAYMVAIAAWMGFLYSLIIGRATRPILRRFAWGVAGGSITGLQNFLKDSLTIVKNYSDNLLMLPPLFYFFMVCAVMSSLVGLLLLTACMKRYDATYSSSMFVGSFVISASVMAAARYNTFQNLVTVWNFILYPTGLLVLLAGIYVLATHEHKEHGNGNGQSGHHAAGGCDGSGHHLDRYGRRERHHPHGNGGGAGAGGQLRTQEGGVTAGSKRNPLQKVKDAALGTRKNHAVGATYREII